MYTPTHNLIAHGKGGVFTLDLNLQEINYGKWCVSLNSVGFFDVKSKLDILVEISSSLVIKNIGSFSGSVTSREPLFVVKISTDTRKTINVFLDSKKYFRINNVAYKTVFQLTLLSQNGGEIPADLEGVMHFSLYKLG
jgi:hypothetical protein